MERVEMTKEQALNFVYYATFDFNKTDKEISTTAMHALNRVMGNLMAVLESRHKSEEEKELAIYLTDILQDSLQDILIEEVK